MWPASAVAPKPVIAIGGIGADNAREVAGAGAAGAAVISAVAAQDDPERAVRALVDALRAGGTTMIYTTHQLGEVDWAVLQLQLARLHPREVQYLVDDA